jgi:hypothetical protein
VVVHTQVNLDPYPIWKSSIAQTPEKERRKKTKAKGYEGQQIAIDERSKTKKKKRPPQ